MSPVASWLQKRYSDRKEKTDVSEAHKQSRSVFVSFTAARRRSLSPGVAQLSWRRQTELGWSTEGRPNTSQLQVQKKRVSERNTNQNCPLCILEVFYMNIWSIFHFYSKHSVVLPPWLMCRQCCRNMLLFGSPRHHFLYLKREPSLQNHCRSWKETRHEIKGLRFIL